MPREGQSRFQSGGPIAGRNHDFLRFGCAMVGEAVHLGVVLALQDLDLFLRSSTPYRLGPVASSALQLHRPAAELLPLSGLPRTLPIPVGFLSHVRYRPLASRFAMALSTLSSLSIGAALASACSSLVKLSISVSGGLARFCRHLWTLAARQRLRVTEAVRLRA